MNYNFVNIIQLLSIYEDRLRHLAYNANIQIKQIMVKS